jgi:nucleoside-diphosphate-sugar epimerase
LALPAHEQRLVALTGATGFVGRVLTATLLEAGFKVRALIRSNPADWSPESVEFVKGDLGSPEALETLCRGAHVVVHLAGAIAGRSEADFVRVNAIGSRNLTDALEQHVLRPRLIHVSSLAARMPTLSAYAYSKHLAEQVVRSSQLEWIILRPPAIYGPTDPALAPLWRMLARGWLLQAGADTARFSLLHVDDLCRALVALIVHPDWAPGRLLCLDDGHPRGYTWADVGDIGSAVLGRPVKRVRMSKTILKAFATANLGLSRILGYTPLLSPGKVRELTHPDWVCGDNEMHSIPGWQAHLSLDRALPQLPGWKTA